MSATFKIDSLRHHKGGRLVLDIPKMTLSGPGPVALVGDNGAGKTTLLRLLGGVLEQPSEGVVTCTAPPRSVVLVDQEPYLFSGSVAANVGYGLSVRRVPHRARLVRVDEALDRVGLHHHGRRVARELSGGERRRVALARALVLNPVVLLLDEPDAGLDRDAVSGLAQVIGNVGATCLVVFSSHNRDLAHGLAQRVITLQRGQVVTAKGVP